MLLEPYSHIPGRVTRGTLVSVRDWIFTSAMSESVLVVSGIDEL